MMSQPAWYDIAIERERRQREVEAQQEVQSQAEEEAAKVPRNAVEALRAAIHGSNTDRSTMALNSAELLGAALAGGAGTINAEIFQGRNE